MAKVVGSYADIIVIRHPWEGAANGKDRREAMDKMSRALSECMLTGESTISFQQAILQDPNFRRGVYTTNFVEQLLSGARRELIEEKA